MKHERTRALLPQTVARLVGLAALASLGALEWQRLIDGYSSARALLWAAVAVVAAALVAACERLPPRRLSALALPAVVAGSVLTGYLLSGADVELLRPRHWDTLVDGLINGLQSLGTVKLPYSSADPWPEIVLELLGAELLIVAGLLTFWPRIAEAPPPRVPIAVHDRGYPFIALAVLIVVVMSPVISLGGTRSLLFGLAIAALTVVFLWLERLPLRPGFGVAGLLIVALMGALPLAAVADRGEPWFDYRAFAERLGPDDPIRFSWRQGYGPLNWPRDGNEVLRVSSSLPLYWKARNLDVFEGDAWTTRYRPVTGGWGPDEDMPDRWQETDEDWTEEIRVSVRRMRSQELIGAGTTLRVFDSSRAVRPGISPGTWDVPTALRRNDSYSAEVRVPRPTPEQLAEALSGEREQQDGQRVIVVPFRPGMAPRSPLGAMSTTVPARYAQVHFKAWDGNGQSFASYASVGPARSDYDIDGVMARTEYARTWELSKRLREGTEHAIDYVRNVYEHLRQPEFRYSETPPQPVVGRAPLDFFLNDSRVGYCQHFAGAMALLLRMGGVPARVAVGFSPGGYSERRDAWIIRDTDAHAWVEVWFDEFGWVAIDPTPDASPARSQIAQLAPETSTSPVVPDRQDDAESDEGGGSQASVPPDLRVGQSQDAEVESASRWWLWPLVIVLALALLVALILFIRRPRGATPVDRAIAEVEDALRRVGRPVSNGTTLDQLAQRLGSHSPEAAAYLRALAAGRYGPQPEPPPPSGRRALRRVLAEGLGISGRARALWALPPRVERRPRAFEAPRNMAARGGAPR